MISTPHQIVSIKEEIPGVFVLRVVPLPSHPPITFTPGQFCRITNPDYQMDNGRFFSICSAPQADYLEFAFKVYGDWTLALSQKQHGSTLLITGPYGTFTWDDSYTYAVFLAGGIGITPFLSMLRHIQEKRLQLSLTLIYGSRTPADIAFRHELETLVQSLPRSKVIHVLSDVTKTDQWDGYCGFISKQLLDEEVVWENSPIFFICGPPPFVSLCQQLLATKGIPQKRIKAELF